MGTIDKDCDQYMVHNGIVMQKITPEEFRIDTSLVPDHVRDNQTEVTLDYVRTMVVDPEIWENVAERKRAKRHVTEIGTAILDL